MNLIKTEDVGSAGDPTLVAKFEKQSDMFTSAYLHNVRVHAIVDDIAGASTPAADMPLNFLFTLSTSDSSSPSTNLIAAAATGYGGGSVSLSARRRIVTNDVDPEAGDGVVCLWVETTDATVSANIDMRCVVEAWGRWHTVVSA